MSDFYTLIMGWLAHLFMISWFEIMEFSQFLIIFDFLALENSCIAKMVKFQ